MKLHASLLAVLSASAITNVGADIATVPATAEEMVLNLFAVSPFVSFTDASMTGNEACAGLFTGGESAVPSDFPDTGVVISTGNPASLHLQSTDRESNMNGAEGDSDLDALVEGETTDACILEFTFECTRDPCPIQFEYVFGSEEYNEFASSPFNDVFAWFLNGENIALVPGTSEEVSINNVNTDNNSQYFRNNDPSDTNVPFPLMEADGFTTTLNASGDALPGANTMKLVIADRSDQMFDSWALFKTGSFDYTPPVGGGGGDPHFHRWGQKNHDTFHGECDLVILHSDSFHNHAGLDFHVRTTLHENMYSYIDSAAVGIGENIVEVHNGRILLNKNDYNDDDLPLTFSDGGNKYEISLTRVQYQKTGDEVIRRTYSLKLDDESKIDFKFYTHFMTFDLIGHEDFFGASGMLGAYPSGMMLDRDGKEMERFVDFGFEWQVRPSDSILFSELRAPQLPYERCRIPTQTAQAARRRLLRGDKNDKLFDDAKKACAMQTVSDFKLCVDDVMMTGDLGMAAEW